MEQVHDLPDPLSWLGWRGSFPVHWEVLIDELSLPLQEIQEVAYLRFVGLSDSDLSALLLSLTRSSCWSTMLWIALYMSTVWIMLERNFNYTGARHYPVYSMVKQVKFEKRALSPIDFGYITPSGFGATWGEGKGGGKWRGFFWVWAPFLLVTWCISTDGVYIFLTACWLFQGSATVTHNIQVSNPLSSIPVALELDSEVPPQEAVAAFKIEWDHDGDTYQVELCLLARSSPPCLLITVAPCACVNPLPLVA